MIYHIKTADIEKFINPLNPEHEDLIFQGQEIPAELIGVNRAMISMIQETFSSQQACNSAHHQKLALYSMSFPDNMAIKLTGGPEGKLLLVDMESFYLLCAALYREQAQILVHEWEHIHYFFPSCQPHDTLPGNSFTLVTGNSFDWSSMPNPWHDQQYVIKKICHEHHRCVPNYRHIIGNLDVACINDEQFILQAAHIDFSFFLELLEIYRGRHIGLMKHFYHEGRHILALLKQVVNAESSYACVVGQYLAEHVFNNVDVAKALIKQFSPTQMACMSFFDSNVLHHPDVCDEFLGKPAHHCPEWFAQILQEVQHHYFYCLDETMQWQRRTQAVVHAFFNPLPYAWLAKCPWLQEKQTLIQCLQQLSNHLHTTKHELVPQVHLFYKIIPQKFYDNQQVCLEVVKLHPCFYQFLLPSLRHDEHIIQAYLNGGGFTPSLPKEILFQQNEPAVVTQIIKENHLLLNDPACPPSWRTTHEYIKVIGPDIINIDLLPHELEELFHDSSHGEAILDKAYNVYPLLPDKFKHYASYALKYLLFNEYDSSFDINHIPKSLWKMDYFCLNAMQIDASYGKQVAQFLWHDINFLNKFFQQVDNNDIDEGVFAYIPCPIQHLFEFFGVRNNYQSFFQNLILQNHLKKNLDIPPTTQKKTTKI